MRRSLAGWWFVGSFAAACGKGDTPPPPSNGATLTQETGPAQRRSAGGEPNEAERTFISVCSKCHGADGTGRGELAANLDPRPRNYTDAKWQASTTDDEIRKIILLGGAGVGKSAMMPPSPTLKDKPEVVDELVRIIRRFAAK